MARPMPLSVLAAVIQVVASSPWPGLAAGTGDPEHLDVRPRVAHGDDEGIDADIDAGDSQGACRVDTR